MAAALEKDAELDRRIAALRRKNEALVRRYQEIEEDRRRAEREGGAVTAPRPRRDPPGHPEWEQRRLQNIEQMNEEMEKIAEYERSRRDGVPEKNPVRNFLDDPRRCGPEPGGGPGGGSRRHGRNWGGPDFTKPRQRGGPRSGPSPPLDPTLCMTGRERAEYERWKRERERIDRERLQRHRDPQGAWRREWDAQKPEGMFPEESEGGGAAPPPPRPPPPLPHRRRRGRGRGGRSYSFHDDRWEPQPEPPPEPPNPESPEKVPEGSQEDSDQWEDVSEEEEEEEEPPRPPSPTPPPPQGGVPELLLPPPETPERSGTPPDGEPSDPPQV